MKNNIYISTGAFKDKDLNVILDNSLDNDFLNIELSAGVSYSSQSVSLIKKAVSENNFNFLLHNYFPPPEDPFVLNLASNDSKTIKRSRNHCRKAIDLCAEMGIDFYSVHAGFCFHAGPGDLGKKQSGLTRIPMDDARSIFSESIQMLSGYGKHSGVDLAIENNVLASFNLIEGKNHLLLGVDCEDMLEIVEYARTDNVFILLDVGHLKVSAQSLGFDPEDFIRWTAPHTRAVHLSENDGMTDSNQPGKENSWFWEPLQKYLDNKETYYVLEAGNLSAGMIKEQLALIDTKINGTG